MDIATLGLRVDANGAVRGMNDFSKSTDRATKAGEAAERMARQLKSALATIGLSLGLRELAQYADSWRLIASRIDLVTKSAGDSAAVQSELFKVAQQTRTSYEATAQLYTRVARNADQLGRSQKDVLAFTKAIQEAVLVSGATAEEASAGIIQLSQALASGVLRGDEFQSTTEQLPGVMRLLQEATGKTAGELRNMANAGQLSANLVVASVLKMKDSIDQTSQGIPLTIGQAFTTLTNNIRRFVGQMDSAAGVSNTVSSAIVTVGSHLDRVAAGIAAAVTAWIAYNIAVRAAAVYNALVTATQTIAAFLSLAKTIRSAADAMALLSILGKGAAGAAVAVLAAVGGFVAYEAIIKKINAESAKFNATLDDQAKGIGTQTTLTDAQIKAIKEQNEANAARVLTARQALELATLEGTALARQQVEYKAVNDSIAARNTLTGEMLTKTLAAIEQERKLGLLAVDVGAAYDDQRKRADKAADAQKKALEDRRLVLENLLRSMQDQFSQFFEGVFKKGINSFRDLVSGIRDLFMKMLADILAARVMSKLAGALGGLLGIGKDPNSVGAQQMAAGVVMLDAAKLQLLAANRMAMGASPEGTPQPLPPVAVTGYSRTQQVAAGAGIGLAGLGVGYGVGSALYSPSHSTFQNYALGTLGGAASGAATGAAIGALGGPIGVATGALIGGITGAIGGFLGIGKASHDATRKMQEAQAALKSTMDAFAASVHHDTLGVALAQAAADETARRKAINDAEPGKKNEAKRNQDLANDARLYQEQVQQIKDAYAQQKLYADQDLNVRLLRAKGLTDQADAMAFANAQQKEYNDAVAAGADAAYLAKLKEVERAEAIARTTDALKDAIRNEPTGFKIAGYQYEYAIPTAPRITPPTLTPPSVLTQPASTGLSFHIETVSIDGSKDPKATFDAFMSELKKKASQTVGTNVPLSTAIDRM